MLDRGRIRRCWWRGLLAAIFLTGIAGTAVAQTGFTNVYEVSVAVDVTARTAAEARTKAINDGERQAFEQLLARLTLLEDRDRLPKLGAKGIATLVKDFSVADEKTSAVRYLAKLTVRFKRREIRKLLTDLNIPFAETRSKPALVLPVYQAAGALMLFDDPNPWREAWTGLSSRDNLVTLILPRGDLTDIAAIGSEQAVQGDQQRLNAIARRYRAGDVLVAFARLRLDLRTSRPQLEAELVRYGASGSSRIAKELMTANPGETPQGLLNRMAELMARLIEDQWKADNLLQFDQSGVLAIAVPITDLRMWLVIRQRLEKVPVVRRIDLVLLSREEVRANLHYIGELEQLTMGLEQADLRLSEGGDGWILRPIQAQQGQKPSNQ